MNTLAYCLFKTSMGYCGVAWSIREVSDQANYLSYFQLPEASLALTEAKLARFCGVQVARQPPPDIADLIHKVDRHFDGDIQDFQDVSLDLTGTGAFAQSVYTTVRSIPAGQTWTYGQVAKAIQRPSAARAVGHALGRNPVALIIPCHRVLAANGNLCGFSAHGGVGMKLRMLQLEGVKIG